MIASFKAPSMAFAVALGLGAAAAPMVGLAQPAARQVAPVPTIDPVPDDGNLPFNSARYGLSKDYGDFAHYGYVEKEFYISGNASTRDQESGAVLKANLPYVSRIVVRMPANPKAFSGNVLIEPFHAIYEKTDMWLQLHQRITERGDIWIGVTVKAYGRDMEPTSAYMLGGIPALKAYDPVRYGRLHLEPDMRQLYPAPPAPTPPQALDLMTQAGALARAGTVLKGFDVKKVYAVGSGIGGEVVANYVRLESDAWKTAAGQQIFDGYFYGITGRFPVHLPTHAALVLYRGTNEIDRAAASGFIGKGPNTAQARIYNVVGLSHINSRDVSDNESPLAQLNSVLPDPQADMPKMPYIVEPKLACPNLNDEPVDLALDALLVGMEEWGSHGTPLPESPEPQIMPGDADAPPGDVTGAIAHSPKRALIVKTDPVTGTMLGGVRMPWVDAPVAGYPVADPRMAGMMKASPGDIMHGGGPPLPGGPPLAGAPHFPPPPPGPPIEPSDSWPLASKAKPKLPTKPGPPMAFCFLFNPRLPLASGKLHTLYANYDDYVAKFNASKARAVQARWLLKEDADTLRPRGTPDDFK